MLSELLFNGAEKRSQIKDPKRDPGLSCSGLFPCAYRMYQTHTGKLIWETTTPVNELNLEDGWDQEAQTVRRLAREGIVIESRGWEEGEVIIGRSRLKGHIDGEVVLDRKRRIWEHKAFGINSFYLLKREGIEAFPTYKCQVNAYMLGRGLDSCIFMAKLKDTNDYIDIEVPYEKDFFEPILEWVDKIRLDGWVPKPEESEYCSKCRLDCFGVTIDFSRIGVMEAPEVVAKWKQGDILKKAGEKLLEEAKNVLIGVRDRSNQIIQPGLLGDKKVVFVEDLKVSKVPQRQHYIDPNTLVEKYGPEALAICTKEKIVNTYRIRLMRTGDESEEDETK